MYFYNLRFDTNAQLQKFTFEIDMLQFSVEQSDSWINNIFIHHSKSTFSSILNRF